MLEYLLLIQISFNDIVIDNIDNEYYGAPENYHIIDKMSYGDELIFNDANKNIISFSVTKWKKKSDKDGLHWMMYGEPLKFSIKLTKNDHEKMEIDEQIDYYQCIKNNNKKIVVINEFI